MRSPSSSLSDGRSIPAGTLICRASSMPSRPRVTQGSLNLTKPSAPWSHSNDTYASLIIPHLANSNTPSCPPLVWVPIPPNQALEEEGGQKGQVEEERSESPVTSGIGEPVISLPPSASSLTAATGLKGCRGSHKKSDCPRLSKAGEGSK